MDFEPLFPTAAAQPPAVIDFSREQAGTPTSDTRNGGDVSTTLELHCRNSGLFLESSLYYASTTRVAMKLDLRLLSGHFLRKG